MQTIGSPNHGFRNTRKDGVKKQVLPRKCRRCLGGGASCHLIAEAQKPLSLGRFKQGMGVSKHVAGGNNCCVATGMTAQCRSDRKRRLVNFTLPGFGAPKTPPPSKFFMLAFFLYSEGKKRPQHKEFAGPWRGGGGVWEGGFLPRFFTFMLFFGRQFHFAWFMLSCPSKYERFPPSPSHTFAFSGPRPFLARPRPALARPSPGPRPALARPLPTPRLKQSSRQNGQKRNLLAPPTLYWQGIVARNSVVP